MIQASNIPVSLDALLPENDGLFRREVARALSVRPVALGDVRLLKRSIDARKKANVHGVVTVAVALGEGVAPDPRPGVAVRPYEPTPPLEIPCVPAAWEVCDSEGGHGRSDRERDAAVGVGKASASGASRVNAARPVVVGAGPAGLFCALYLARAGLRPIVVERGAAVEERTRAVETFAQGGPLDANTNIQFGEGGAGTFSDGKLNTGIKSPHIRHVLEVFVEAGAPDDILVDAKPHIGTDLLVDVVRNLRRAIIEAGGEVRFLTRLEAIDVRDGAVRAVRLLDERTGETSTAPCGCVVLACGHSARDTFAMVCDTGLALERKPFAVGVRIEHPQALIDQVQYGEAAGHPALGAADYKLAVHTGEGRGVYTFCMCPGGEVVAAASEAGGLCVNGMSRHARDGINANSAILVEVRPDDLPGDDPLAGVEFQRSLERAAFELGGMGWRAPAQRVGDFLAGRPTPLHALDGEDASVRPTYPRGVREGDLRECLPLFVTDALAAALPLLDRKLPGFADGDAVMTAVEARSSSPVRIVRDEGFRARAADGGIVAGLYPCGEGAGYAGGITSAAVDGLRVAEAIVASALAERGARAEGDSAATGRTTLGVSATLDEKGARP